MSRPPLYVISLSGAHYVMSLAGAHYVMSLAGAHYVMSLAGAHFVMSLAGAHYVMSLAGAHYVMSLAGAHYVLSLAGAHYVMSLAGAHYVLSLAGAHYVMSLAGAHFVMSLAGAHYVMSLAGAHYVMSLAGAHYVISLFRAHYVISLFKAHYVISLSRAHYVISLAGAHYVMSDNQSISCKQDRLSMPYMYKNQCCRYIQNYWCLIVFFVVHIHEMISSVMRCYYFHVKAHEQTFCLKTTNYSWTSTTLRKSTWRRQIYWNIIYFGQDLYAWCSGIPYDITMSKCGLKSSMTRLCRNRCLVAILWSLVWLRCIVMSTGRWAGNNPAPCGRDIGKDLWFCGWVYIQGRCDALQTPVTTPYWRDRGA